MGAKDGGALPDSGFPHDGGKAKEGLRATNNLDTKQHTVQLIHHKHSSMGVVLGGYTFEACIIGGVRVRCGVGEVDVLGTLREVVLLF